MIFRLSLIILLTLPLAACGTMLGSREIVSVDSSPRGMDVYRPASESKTREREKLGKTPLYIEAERAYSRRFEIVDPNTKKRLDVRQGCGGRWLESVLPNVVVGVANVAVGVAFFVVDAVTANIADCDDRVVVAFPKGSKGGEVCQSLLLAPPFSGDEDVSDRLAKAWIDGVEDKLGDCDEVLFDDASKDALAYLNLDYDKRISYETLPSQRILELGKLTGATHFVTLSSERRRDGSVQIKPTIHDIHTDKKLDGKPFDLTVKDPALARRLRPSGRSLFSFDLFPNAVTFSEGLLSTEVYSAPQGFKRVSTEHKRTMPRYIANWALDSIEHPSGYRTWDYAFAFFPSLSGHFDDIRVGYRREPGEKPSGDDPVVVLDREIPDEFEYRLRYYYVLSQMNGGVTAHTPAGAFSLSIGAGLSYLRTDDNLGYSHARVDFVNGANVSYYAFMTRQLYLLLEMELYYSRNNEPRAELYGLDGWTKASFGLGWFFPSARRVVKGLFR